MPTTVRSPDPFSFPPRFHVSYDGKEESYDYNFTFDLNVAAGVHALNAGFVDEGMC